MQQILDQTEVLPKNVQIKLTSRLMVKYCTFRLTDYKNIQILQIQSKKEQESKFGLKANEASKRLQSNKSDNND